MGLPSPITQVHVCGTEAAPGLKRILRLPGPVYMYVGRDPDYGPAISRVAVGAPPPPGYQCIVSEPVAISIARGEDPIIDIRVLCEDQDPQPGFVKVPEAVAGTHYLSYLTQSAAVRATRVTFEVGQLLDCLDTVSCWCIARIMDVTGSAVEVHYLGWPDKWDEWIPKSSRRMAPLHTHTPTKSVAASSPTLTHENVIEYVQSLRLLQALVYRDQWTASDWGLLEATVSAQVKALLNSTVADPALLHTCSCFFQAVMDVLLILLEHQSMPGKMLVTLVRLLGGDAKCQVFYTRYGTSRSDAIDLQGLCVRSRVGTAYTSTFLLGNCLRFVQGRGLEAVYQSLAVVDLDTGHELLAVVVSVADSLDADLAQHWVHRCRALLLHRMTRVSAEDIKGMDRQHLQHRVSGVEALLGQSHTPQETRYQSEVFQLDLALQLLRCPYLAKRLLGMSRIVDMLESVAPPDDDLSESEEDTTEYLSPAYLVHWIEDQDLLGVVLGPNTHNELLSRSGPVFRFLLRQHHLTDTHLRHLWHAGARKHEVVARAVHSLILELVDSLRPEQLSVLYQEMSQHTDMNELTLEFFESFTAQALAVTGGQDGWFAIDMFWDLLLDSAPNTLCDQAYQALLRLLDTPQCEELKPVYLQRCIDNLCVQESVEFSLRLASDMILSLPLHHHRAEIILQCNELCPLVDTVVAELQSYRDSSPSPAAGLHLRLSFLELCLSNTCLTLSTDNIDRLWDVFVRQPVSGGTDAGLLLQWLAQTRTEDPDTSSMSDEVTAYVFTEYLCAKDHAVDVSALDEHGYRCFDTLFLYVNGVRGALAYPFLTQRFAVRDVAGLQGMDTLWGVVARATHPLVLEHATATLVYVHLILAPGVDRPRVWRDFLHRAMAGVRAATTDPTPLLDALHLFLSNCNPVNTRSLEAFGLALEEDPAPADPEYAYPKTLLINDPEYFALLLRLLDRGVDAAWRVVQACPLNTRLCERVAEASTPGHWLELLAPEHSAMALGYTLQVVDAHPVTDGPWRARFLAPGGGLDRLYDLVLSGDLPPDTLDLLLRLVGRFPRRRRHGGPGLAARLWAVVHGAVAAPSPVLATALALLRDIMDPGAPIPDLADLLVRGLVQCEDPGTRGALGAGLLALAPHAALVPGLLGCLARIPARSDRCDDYFDLVVALLDRGPVAAPHDLARLLVRRIRAHPVVEGRAAAGPQDHVLGGLLRLAATLVRRHPALKPGLGALVHEVHTACLFRVPEPRGPGPKCKLAGSRAAAFALLLELVSGCPPNAEVLAGLLMPQHLDPVACAAPVYEETADTGYVGLVNLGCTCYINSLLQQLYMLPRVRAAVLAVPGLGPDSFLYQLQHIFGFLQESERPYCDMAAFCHTFKEWDGSPTDISVQKDAHEFLNLLFDRIDTLVEHSAQERCLKDEVAGTFTNEIVCKGCPHTSERDEPFYCVTLEVKNKKSVLESLEAFVEGEMLEGDNAYLCGQCDKKVDSLKRVVLKDLPNTLILHLKRFELDFNTMEMAKLNGRVEFPHELDMRPYTREHPSRDDAYYQYQLAGVLVHTGSAHGGHYYSFIKERSSRGHWLQFNDAQVSDFDPEEIPDECFGGQELRRYAHHHTERRRNGYLLFYDRVQVPDLAAERVRVPDPILEEIWKDNLVFWKTRYLTDPSYWTFLHGLMGVSLGDEEDGPRRAVAELGTRFYLGTLVECSPESLVEWVEVLVPLYRASASACQWLVDTSFHCGWVTLVDSPSPLVQESFSTLLACALSVVPSSLVRVLDLLLGSSLDLLRRVAVSSPTAVHIMVEQGVLARVLDMSPRVPGRLGLVAALLPSVPELPALNQLLGEALDPSSTEAIIAIHATLCARHPPSLASIIDHTLATIKSSTHEHIIYCLQVLQALISSDTVAVILPPLLTIMYLNKGYWKVTDICIQFLLQWSKAQPCVFTFLSGNNQDLDWVQTWLEDNQAPPPSYPRAEGVRMTKPLASSLGYQVHYHFGMCPEDKLRAVTGILAADATILEVIEQYTY